MVTKKERASYQHDHRMHIRLLKSFSIGIVAISLALAAGMWGYHHFETMPWTDAFVNAAMILSGMGPVSTLATESGKLFAGFYALFSGLYFIFMMALIFSPLLHRFFTNIHEGRSE